MRVREASIPIDVKGVPLCSLEEGQGCLGSSGYVDVVVSPNNCKVAPRAGEIPVLRFNKENQEDDEHAVLLFLPKDGLVTPVDVELTWSRRDAR